ncbi:MAG: 2-oxo-4-hydroxy-4-carboxy-5-ureidoimidazoline decarboxylase [Microlunatus sp.]|nr:2-oxo-4-hydroxy-4-carboxy-5-ureidoimidazoline decarboxylase [Microlunatus sp.]MDN5769999.1 2-oxo-4-hydroxy-4-carboxy-5-ureidoimidazoline decarboxylase [Microlunatus sp.]MDN5803773.1 2-oxo-4-hydroxy-4-carboxy-5-ureidoimidazoline decarboxylase [Microlunatus sp.]
MAMSISELPESELRDGLLVCLHVPRWVDDVAARAPYSSMAELQDSARAAATPLAPEEIDQALATHPRIGERAQGEDKAARLAKAEQSASTASDPILDEALASGNKAYEDKFGRIFLIRAAGRSRAKILAELNRRLTLDSDTELTVVGQELRDIALLRIPQVFSDYH